MSSTTTRIAAKRRRRRHVTEEAESLAERVERVAEHEAAVA
jgi:hypothetical protein